MPIAASYVIREAADILFDPTSVRWTVDKLVRYFNDGQREILIYRPDALKTEQAMPLVAGPRQTLPSTGMKLIDIPRNTNGAAVRLFSRKVLDAMNPDWPTMTGATKILHYDYDEKDPRKFWVYPPAAATGASLDLIFTIYPTDITAPAAGQTWSNVTGNMALPDEFSGALRDYIVYRAYSENFMDAYDAAKAASHYQAMGNALGVDLKGTIGVSPRAPAAPAAQG